MRFLDMDLFTILVTAICLMITIVAHELAHGTVALWMGDPTAKNAGRLTLNPLKHLDPIGALSMLLFRFGWAKPVPINPLRFRNRKLGMILVSAAGAFTNLLLAMISIVLLFKLRIENAFILELLNLLVIYNVYFAIFNLLPFPPLDGSKILFTLLPEKVENFFYQYERYFYIILVALLFTGVTGRFLAPAAAFVINWMIRLIA